ncbi:uncharacterized protein LOC127094220 [Lathyrus oleraceus]|uniref:uncharacterized protein LOC127094220 n=1 Tax=Pisum sativum TaxID=3888 RepID=UPI0021D296DA|nr:uncharacterized protein LOC127094220 [Pisum sativum]
MAKDQNRRPLKEFAQLSNEEPRSSIVNPTIPTNNFELKPFLLQLVQQNQYAGLATENPNQHLKVFIQLTDTFKTNGASPEGESLFEAWERYKELLRACPYHGLEQWLIIHTFYNGLHYNTKMSIDVAAGGALLNKPYPDACALIEDMAQNHYQWDSEQASVKKRETKGGIHEVICMDMMKTKMDALALKVEHMSANHTAAIAVDYEIYGTKGHLAPEYNLLTESNSNQVNYAQGNPFSNTYNLGWRNHPNLSYKNNNPIQSSTPQRPPGFQAQKPILPM